ncbi:uncharacterized protein LOC124636476 [Helicoverpa zea]|uniref:uncharacterized protein LOC124636476 n=1 Tax=Helicoverpa zea TaxID=7113 RepID=UPI001F591A27|nr:uncharacterized protein LOC124636476 [Helicoverpa zea]XP_047028536.1 uncharacterized protein LOC124636476 [Helicoverpa zea]XP_047028537.1 uncharacterized protein LOC124636476 [Helicoverpa zea]
MDWPVWKKCCFCIPLRYGLLTWGYLKLISASIVLSFFIFILVGLADYIRNDTLVIVIPIIAIMVTDIALHILCIVGAHKKNVRLLEVYYCYAWFMWAGMIIMFAVCTILLVLIFSGHGESGVKSLYLTMDIVGFLLGIVIHTFLLISLRSEMIKLRSNCPYRFVKNDGEPEGFITSVK